MKTSTMRVILKLEVNLEKNQVKYYLKIKKTFSKIIKFNKK